MFDLTDLKSDLNEFNDFYMNNQNLSFERPQNPFHKNFESYNSHRPTNQRNSFSDLEAAQLLLGAK